MLEPVQLSLEEELYIFEHEEEIEDETLEEEPTSEEE